MSNAPVLILPEVSPPLDIHLLEADSSNYEARWLGRGGLGLPLWRVQGHQDEGGVGADRNVNDNGNASRTERTQPELQPLPIVVAPTPLQDMSVAGQFLEGYRAGGGDPYWEAHLIDVIQCETEWRLDSPGIHLGLAQFTLGTWVQARCSPEADYRDPYEQGCAVARWMSMIGQPGSSEGWPTCWWR